MKKLQFSPYLHQQYSRATKSGEWRVRGLRGAITVNENSVAAMTEAVDELLDVLEAQNQLNPNDIVSATFSATQDLNAMFPAAVARHRPGWEQVPLLDVQQMQVTGSLECCIRVLIHLNTPLPQNALNHAYLRLATKLRPDLACIS